MSGIQMFALVLVAAGGTAVALTRDLRRQILMSSFYGLLLAILFFAFQSPDVALSELTVGAAALPALLLMTLAAVRRPVQTQKEEEPDGGSQ